ncbi:hypothetical protein Y032_0152g2857 [Ancylostoma ceylanicum]|nr:hypothetical protein Y032_0152g2857 [Ancylostoma ceylanicum]
MGVHFAYCRLVLCWAMSVDVQVLSLRLAEHISTCFVFQEMTRIATRLDAMDVLELKNFLKQENSTKLLEELKRKLLELRTKVCKVLPIF